MESALARAELKLQKEVYVALTNALTALSKQYEAEMEQQAERAGELQEQVRQLGRTEGSAKDLKQQVELLAANYKEIAEVLRGV